jgi:RNA polymerase sigma-70 factor (ECF subfamily)
MDPDARLVELARAGDLAAFERLVERHRAIVVRVAGRIVGPDAAEDVAQDAFLRAFHRLPRFRADAPFRAWLLRIAQNAALDALARSRRDPAPAVADDDSAVAVADAAERRPAESLAARGRRDRLAGKLRQLRGEHRVVLVLRDLEGLSYEEIADVTGTPLGSVKGRLHRARRELIGLLERNTYDCELPR